MINACKPKQQQQQIMNYENFKLSPLYKHENKHVGQQSRVTETFSAHNFTSIDKTHSLSHE